MDLYCANCLRNYVNAYGHAMAARPDAKFAPATTILDGNALCTQCATADVTPGDRVPGD